MRITNLYRMLLSRTLAAIAVAGVLAVGAGPANAELKNVKIAVSGTSFLDIAYFFVMLPGPLGYWEEEGYTAEIFPIRGSSEAAQQLAAGNIDFGAMSASVIVQSNSEFSLPIRSLITNFSLGWGFAVKADSPIKVGSDLKGKRIGVVAAAGSSVFLAKSYAKENGLDPETDISFLAVGVGAQPLIALQNGDVDALLYWSSALVGYQNEDPTLRIIKDPKWAELPDYSFATIQQKIDEDPEMVTAISRGVAKAMTFAAANPDCARQVFWESYPDSKPTGNDEAKMAADDLAKISILLEDQANASAMNAGNIIAGTSAEALGKYQDFLLEVGVLTKEVDPAVAVIPEAEAFFAAINDFDKAAIEADAIACNY